MVSRDFLRQAPKIDLHCHLEGSLSWKVLETLARRHHLPLPSLRFRGFEEFLRKLGDVSDLLTDEEDFHLAAHDLLTRARRLNVLHVEVLFSPQILLRRGVPLHRILAGLESARRATRGRGPSSVFILDGVRQWGGKWLHDVVRHLPDGSSSLVAGIGIGGMEPSLPPAEFLPAVRLARRRGLRVTVHAGEHAGPQHVREVLDVLAPDRIGHGVAAARDRKLLARLARRRIPLEVCLSSNLATGATPSLRRHPLRRLMESGAPVTLNSDDGTFFGTDILLELVRGVEGFGLEAQDLRRMTLDAARGAFLPAGKRAALARRVGSVFDRLRSSPRASGRS